MMWVKPQIMRERFTYQLGAELCKKYKESHLVINTVESHHGDVEQRH